MCQIGLTGVPESPLTYQPCWTEQECWSALPLLSAGALLLVLEPPATAVRSESRSLSMAVGDVSISVTLNS